MELFQFPEFELNILRLFVSPKVGRSALYNGKRRQVYHSPIDGKKAVVHDLLHLGQGLGLVFI